jgi:chorismate lyase / 3-hydroxybenzoate synthase
VHAGDVAAQTRESLANIDAVVTEANRVASRNRFAMQHLCYKVYVRNPGDLELVRAEVRRCVGGTAHVTFLRADICRSDLLVEVEASGGHELETR